MCLARPALQQQEERRREEKERRKEEEKRRRDEEESSQKEAELAIREKLRQLEMAELNFSVSYL